MDWKRIQSENSYNNKAFKRNKNSGLRFASLHILTRYFCPLNAALAILDMNYEISSVKEIEKESLAELRIAAMKESLENIGRFDPETARNRFLGSFIEDDTKKVLIDGDLVGFYVVHKKTDHIHLDHLYFFPEHQGQGLGAKVLTLIKEQALKEGLPIRLGALRGSRSNDFYKKHGFIYTHEEEWDLYYEFTHG